MRCARGPSARSALRHLDARARHRRHASRTARDCAACAAKTVLDARSASIRTRPSRRRYRPSPYGIFTLTAGSRCRPRPIARGTVRSFSDAKPQNARHRGPSVTAAGSLPGHIGRACIAGWRTSRSPTGGRSPGTGAPRPAQTNEHPAITCVSGCAHHVPLDVAVERPEARVVPDEAQDRVSVRGDYEGIAPA